MTGAVAGSACGPRRANSTQSAGRTVGHACCARGRCVASPLTHHAGAASTPPARGQRARTWYLYVSIPPSAVTRFSSTLEEPARRAAASPCASVTQPSMSSARELQDADCARDHARRQGRAQLATHTHTHTAPRNLPTKICTHRHNHAHDSHRALAIARLQHGGGALCERDQREGGTRNGRVGGGTRIRGTSGHRGVQPPASATTRHNRSLSHCMHASAHTQAHSRRCTHTMVAASV